MIVRPADEDDIVFVFANMRAMNAREMFALRAREDVDDLIDLAIALRATMFGQWVFCRPDNVPVMLIGAYQVTPTIANLQMVATDEWENYGQAIYLPLARLWRGTRAHCRRAECMILADNGSREWIERLGFVEEARHPARGKHGETFVTMAWVNPAFDEDENARGRRPARAVELAR